MSTEARKPPLQIALKIRRILGGNAGWNGVAVQFAFAAILGWIGYEIVSNARANLENQHIAAGFGFLRNNAGFDVNQTLIPYTGSDTFLRVFVVGLLNTLVVSVVGIVFATVFGFVVALCRLSPNWLLSRIGEIYVEVIRNLPLLFQILFWYLAVLAALPNPRQSISLFGIAFISNRGLVVPSPIGQGGLEPFLAMLGLGIVAGVVGVSNLLRWLLHRYEKATLGALLGLLCGAVVGLWPFQQANTPEIGDVIKGQVVTVENAANFEPEDWPVRFFEPTPMEGAAAVGLVGLGSARRVRGPHERLALPPGIQLDGW